MPVDSQMQGDYDATVTQNFRNDLNLEKCVVTETGDSNAKTENFGHLKQNYISSTNEVQPSSNIVNGNNQKHVEENLASVRPKSYSEQNSVLEYSRPLVPNKWGRMVGLFVSGSELKSSLFSRKLKSSKLRFTQAKKCMNHLYSYFSVRVLNCEKDSDIIVGLARKDFPRTSEIGKGLGSISYSGGYGLISSPHIEIARGLEFSKGDTVGCGILFPSHYRRYGDLSTDDSSDGMTDVVLTSLLNVNKKSMDFVQSVLGLRKSSSDSSSSEEEAFNEKSGEGDYYNENYVESRTQVEVYFTRNMQIVGKIATCIPIGGFYPTIQVQSKDEVRLQFEFS